MTTPLDEIRFILEAKRLNRLRQGLVQEQLRHCVGNTLRHAPELRIIGDCALSAFSYTCAAQTPLAGAMIPVMSNSGKRQPGHRDYVACGRLCRGDQGDEEHLRAPRFEPSDRYLYQAGLGRLSACAAVSAATGSSAASPT